MKKLIYTLLIALTFACETAISPKLDKAAGIIVVDAWLNQKMEKQEIKLNRSQAYFDNTTPTKISGAIITVEDLNTGLKYHFQEGASAYFWNPANSPLGIVGHNYKLTIKLEGETFEAYSKLGGVPPVDSIKFNYNPSDILVKKDYYKAEFMASDLAGVGDAYWIKAWRNGVYLGKPSELNIAFDAGFTASQSVDGQAFNLTIRQDFVNPLDKIPGKQNEFFPPYLVGDSLNVEIHSIDPLAFDFLWAVYFQTNRPGSFAELFATPLSNVPTNLKNLNENSNTSIAGFFNISAISSKGQKLTQEIADEAKKKAN